MINDNISPLHVMWENFEAGEEPDEHKFGAAVGRCLLTMIRAASKAEKPKLSMGYMDKNGGYYTFYYAAEDEALPRDDRRVNWHSQNVSQVLCNGAILVSRDTGEIRIHT
jgi:hypothetical protein